jgi:putative hemolysin
VTVINLLAFVLILALNAFFCAAETALTGAQESRLQTLADEGSASARRVLKLLQQRASVVAGLLVGQNIVGAVLAVYSTIVIGSTVGVSLPPWMAAIIAAVLSILLLLVFGEVIPKSIAVGAPTRIAMAFSWPVALVTWLFQPITWVLALISNALQAMLGTARREPKLTVAEIQAFARMGLAAGTIDELEGAVVAKAAMMNDTRVSEIMCPRTDIQALDVNTPLPEIRLFLQGTPFTRIPMYSEDLDDIVGILNFKEFFRHDPGSGKGFDAAAYLHKPLFVPGAMFVGDLLTKMRQSRTHMAIVLDEYGGTAGLITLEDVVEMLVGRIEDEFDLVETPFERINETTWEIDGRVTDERMVARLGLSLPPEALEGFDTAAGLALKAFGNIPSEGEVTTYHGMEITATRVKGHRVRRVRIRKPAPDEVPPPAGASGRRRTTRQVVPPQPGLESNGQGRPEGE